MDPKFLVMELDSKEQALQLVQIMLEKGFGRLMLVDDLSKHPSLRGNSKTQERASSPIIMDPEPVANEQKVRFPSISQVPQASETIANTGIKREFISPSDIHIEDDEAVEEEEEDAIDNRKRGTKRTYNENNDAQEYREQLMNMLCGDPEIVPIGVNSANDECSTSSPDIPAFSKSKNGEYHECRMCGVRVKTPRSGRWNLQMHVIALHCVGRQYQCKKCDYLDYRKSTMRKHSLAQHGADIPPHNLINDEMKTEWHDAMVKCFPEFAHRTGIFK